jgi:hypothetical protein
MIHDMGRPIESLRTMRARLSRGGNILIMDERVAERFTAPGDEVERFMYLCSLLLCVPTGLADAPSVATGTVMRTATLQGYAAEAGFGDVQVLPIEHPFWRFLPPRPLMCRHSCGLHLLPGCGVLALATGEVPT